MGSDVCPYCGSKTESDMNKADILAKRKALEEQILADEKEVSVLESKIKEGTEKLGISSDLSSIEKALEEKTTLMQEKEKEVNDILSKIDELEREPEKVVQQTVLPEPHAEVSVKVQTKVTPVSVPTSSNSETPDIVDSEDELE